MRPGIYVYALLAAFAAGPATAQVYEVIHPDIQPGGFELEVLSGVTLSDVDSGEERAAHEFAISYAPFRFWKPILAVELAKPQGEAYEVEAVEIASVFLLPFGSQSQQAGHGDAHHGHDHHGHGHDHAHGGAAEPHYALGIYTALEIPNRGGLSHGAFSLGPIAEAQFGPVKAIGNLLLEIPFEDGEDPGIAYALGASTPIARQIDLGLEAHGAFEGALGDALPFDEQGHVIGPALYSAFDLGQGRLLEPRVAALFGVTEASPDAVLSVNFELKF